LKGVIETYMRRKHLYRGIAKDDP